MGLARAVPPDGLVPQLAVAFGVDNESIAVYLARGPVDAGATVVDFLKTGGIAYVRQPAAVGDADAVVGSVGDRAARVEVGPFDAAIVHADPVETDDLRFYELYWSDGTWDYAAFGNVTATSLIDFARSLHCG